MQDKDMRSTRPVLRGLIFLVVFTSLQALWGQARGTAVERLLIQHATVGSAVALIGLMTPQIRAHADGTRIRAAGGGLNILNGCEGVEVLFLLAAAFAAAPLPARRRWLGLASGIVFVFALNQARILALFYAYRSDRSLFDLLHGTAAPVILIALTAMFFLAWANDGRASRRPSDASAAA
ncbi:MAG: archaeosortase/exosortase family protein [Sulfuritalea sp.]|nr:archaeosortase/exosortase family protein [Sulfuritalea sp.]